MFHGAELAQLSENVFSARPKPVWPGGKIPKILHILQSPKHLVGMGVAYQGAPPVELIAGESENGPTYSVMRITRNLRIPGRNSGNLFPAPRANPFQPPPLGTRQEYLRDEAANALGEIPYWCAICCGFWWPEFHGYTQHRMAMERVFFADSAKHGVRSVRMSLGARSDF